MGNSLELAATLHLPGQAQRAPEKGNKNGPYKRLQCWVNRWLYLLYIYIYRHIYIHINFYAYIILCMYTNKLDIMCIYTSYIYYVPGTLNNHIVLDVW